MSNSRAIRSQRFNWLKVTPGGLYCAPGGFFIDPIRPAEKALITHGHADHARPGHKNVLATNETLAIMRHRYRDASGDVQETAPLRQPIKIGDVIASFHPAGHILGSTQILLEHKGERIVFSGDYKRRRDPTCLAFESVSCDLFITEATFGIPVFTHPDDKSEVQKLLDSLKLFPDRAHLVGVYALGKCQRLIMLLRELGYNERIYLHGAHMGLCEVYRSLDVELGDLQTVGESKLKEYGGKIILCPPSALGDRWSRRFGDAVFCIASGWMRVLQRAKQKGIELPMIISDHADWPELLQTVKDVQADTIWVTHGQEDALVYQCRSQGLQADALAIAGLGEEGEDE
ncbi:MAG: ligase-associated DNA damage response exonuclease [Pseudomonadota bacterium]